MTVIYGRGFGLQTDNMDGQTTSNTTQTTPDFCRFVRTIIVAKKQEQRSVSIFLAGWLCCAVLSVVSIKQSSRSSHTVIIINLAVALEEKKELCTMMNDTNNNNNDQSSMSAFGGNEEQNSGTDRIAATLQEIAATTLEVEGIQQEISKINPGINTITVGIEKMSALETNIELLVKQKEFFVKQKELLDKKDELRVKEIELRDKKDELRDKKDELLKDLKNGEYFAKAYDIFPFDRCLVVQFEGAADKMMRECAPGADVKNGQFNPYKNLIVDFKKHLSQDVNDPDASVANIDSVAASDASNYLTNDEKSVEVSVEIPRKQRDLLPRATSRSTPGYNENKARLKCSVIPPSDGHRGHQIPDGPSCVPWWALVCQWAIGKDADVDSFYLAIEEEENPEKRQQMEDRLRRALVLLATGTARKKQGMKDVPQNILYVPYPHTKYYDIGYNWVIIPIMTLEKIKKWKGEPYEVAIFTGENAKKIEGKKEKYDHFKDGPTTHSAVEAEKKLFVGMDPEHINICSKDDLVIVTDVLTEFLRAFADLHTRSRIGNGEPPKIVSPRKWSVVDLADEVKRTFQAASKKKGQDATEDTKIISVDQSKSSIEVLIEEILKNTSGTNEYPGVRVPSCPNADTFDGKHVFKALIKQAYPPDPLLVAAKGTNNFGRQWGVRFMSGCTDKSDSDSSTDMTPPVVFTGLEIAVVTSDQLRPSGLAVTTYNDDDDDAVSDVSFDEDLANPDPAVVTSEK